MIEAGDLQTETFTNSQGWTMVRVTHTASGLVAERERTDALVSPVQAHEECIAELEDRLATGAEPAQRAADEPITRADFDALVARVDELERLLAARDGDRP